MSESVLNLLAEAINYHNHAERKNNEAALANSETRDKLHKLAERLGFIAPEDLVVLQDAVKVVSKASKVHERNHVRRSRKPWHCDVCGKSIRKREMYFAKLAEGAGEAEKIDRRLHLGCVKPEDICCPEAQAQYDKAVSPFPTEQRKFPFSEGGAPSSETVQ